MLISGVNLIKYKVIKLKAKMEGSLSFAEWVEYAKSLDYLEGKDQWKLIKQTRLYDYQQTEARYLSMKQLRKSKDIRGVA